MNALATCRLCHDWHGAKVRYGIRSYAHPKCLMDRKGKSAILALSPYQLRNMPWLFIKENGLEAEVRAIISKSEGQ